MPKTKISEYSTTNSSNTDIEGINIDEGCAPSGINNAIRELMVHLKEFQTGASGDGFTFAGGVLISGTANTITGNVVMSGTNTLSGATSAAFAAGTVSAPSIYASGDTNTGVFFPAADTIAITEGGVEVVRVNSSSNVGIGTDSPGSKLDVKGTLRLSGSSSGYVGIAPAAAAGSTTYTLPSADGTSGQVLSTNGSGTLSWATASGGGGSSISAGDSKVEVTDTGSNGTIAFTTDNSERMRIDSSGNVGIGVTPNNNKFIVKGAHVSGRSIAGIQTSESASGSVIYFAFYNSSDSRIAYVGPSISTSFEVWNAENTPMLIGTNNIERARITSGGEVYIAGTTDQGAYNLQCNGTGVWGAGAYVNGSDARIKEDVAPIDSGLDVVEKLNPVTYRYKEDWSKDQSTQTGFIAQELLVALEGQNYINGVVQQGGSEGYYSVAYQNIIPILTKAIQELKTITDAQTTRIEALEAEVAALEAK